MKAQVTIEMLMLFATTLIAISLMAQALLHSYELAQKQSVAARHRALVENDIFMNELLCNSDVVPPKQVRQQTSTARIRIEKWVIKLVAAEAGMEQEFSGIFAGCYEDATFT